MQINGNTLTKRQELIISGALIREQTRISDAVRIIDMIAAAPEAREHVKRALLILGDEFSNLVDLIDKDQEAAK